jgi:carbamoyl-phosphate synthase large subunit
VTNTATADYGGGSPSALPAQLGTILVTGAGGAAGVTLLRALRGRATLVAADSDPVAVGLYFAPAERRLLLPRGDDPAFVDLVLDEAVSRGVDLVIPTVDIELRPLSAARERFAERGVALLVENKWTLDLCFDKLRLMQTCADVVCVPRTVLLTPDTDEAALGSLGRPLIVRPRRGSGGRGVAVVEDASWLAGFPSDGTILAQEMLPGTEYSVDVLAQADGQIVAAVPRSRDKVNSGIAVAGRTWHDPQLQSIGALVAETIGAVGVVNVQLRESRDGTPALLEVNPRFPGTMSLTMAAGVNMPVLAVAGALGHAVPDSIPFAEVGVVRHWEDVAVPIAEYGSMAPAML